MHIYITGIVAILCLMCQTHSFVYDERTTNSLADSGQLLLRPPNQMIAEFFYIPTTKGFRFGYTLDNGVKRQEISVIPGAELQTNYSNNNNDINNDLNQPLGMDLRGRVDHLSHMLNMLDRNEFRKRQKNRKLSPKSLQSLAG